MADDDRHHRLLADIVVVLEAASEQPHTEDVEEPSINRGSKRE